MNCQGKDSRGYECGLQAFDGRMCYFHLKVEAGLITDYYNHEPKTPDLILFPILSTPRPHKTAVKADPQSVAGGIYRGWERLIREVTR